MTGQAIHLRLGMMISHLIHQGTMTGLVIHHQQERTVEMMTGHPVNLRKEAMSQAEMMTGQVIRRQEAMSPAEVMTGQAITLHREMNPPETAALLPLRAGIVLLVQGVVVVLHQVVPVLQAGDK